MTAIIAKPIERQAPAGPTTMPASGTESLQKGIIHTDVAPRTAKMMTWLFLTAIMLVPAAQLGVELLKHRPKQEFDILRPPVHALKELAHAQPRQAAHTLRAWLHKENLTRYEDALKENSALRHLFQPRMQLAVSKYLGFGNNLALLGHESMRPNGWLFYQLGNDYVAGPGFLEPWFIHHRERQMFDDGEDQVNADPRKAIIAFHEDCKAAGVHLVYVPIPVKQMLQPGELSRRSRVDRSIRTPNNIDYPRFLADLRAAGVDVFDPTPPTISPDDPDRFLEQDTHWTPQYMEQVAQGVADHVKGLLPASSPREWKIQEEQVARVGDIVDTLKLPPTQKLFLPQQVTVHRLLDWKPDPTSDLLVLGDSFSNIYSAPQMEWGQDAGFPEQISRFLHRPVDVIAINGEAAREVRRRLAERPQPLAGKKVIVWEIAMHELSVSNWPVVRIRK